MKKIILTAAVLFSMILVSCDAEKAEVYKPADGTFAYFTSGTAGKLPIKEEAVTGSYYITVGSTTVSPTDRTITVTVNTDGTTATASMYTIDQASLVIPANSYVGKIKITGTYSELPPVGESAILNLTLTSVDGSTVVSEQGTDQYSLKLFRSCAIDNFPLNYDVDVTIPSFSASAPSHQETLVPTEDENTYTVASSWGPNFVAFLTGDDSDNGLYPYDGTIAINCDNTVEFTSETTSLLPGGTGTYDPSSGVITIDLTETLFSGTPFVTTVDFIPID